MKKSQIKLPLIILYSVIIGVVFFLGSFLINNHQQTIEKVQIRVIKINKDSPGNFQFVPTYFKKLDYRYDAKFNYSINASQLMLDLNEKYGTNFKIVPPQFKLVTYEIYSIEINNLKKQKKLKSIKHEIYESCGC